MFQKNHELIVMSVVFLFAIFSLVLIFSDSSDFGLTGYDTRQMTPKECSADPVCVEERRAAQQERRRLVDIERYIDECHREHPGGLGEEDLEVCVLEHLEGLAHTGAKANPCRAMRLEERSDCVAPQERYPQGLGKGLAKTYKGSQSK